MPSVISGDANVSATEFGFLDGVTSALQTQIDSKLNLAGGKILQIVRATDSTQRSTTSLSAADVTGMSVTITPQKNDSAVIIMAKFAATASSGTSSNLRGYFLLTDSSNNALSGAEDSQVFGSNLGTGTSGNRAIHHYMTVIGYSTPATTSATTYKLRFKTDDANTTVRADNNLQTGQMYAIEVSA